MIPALLLLAISPATLNCEGDLPQQQTNLCAAREFGQADVELNAQWQKTSAAMKGADRQIDRTHDREPGYFQTLLLAQRGWLTYSDQHCLGAGFEARGGSLAPFLVSVCKTELTRARTIQLAQLVDHEN